MEQKISTGLGDKLIFQLIKALEVGAEDISHQGNPCWECKITNGSGHFHGSQLGSCRRKLYHEFKEGRITFTGSSSTFLNDGITHQNAIFDTLEKAGYEVHRDVERVIKQGGVNVHLHGDAIIVIGDDDILLECKAVKPPRFKEITKSNVLPAEWYNQVQAYLHGFNIEHAILFMKNRENSSTYLFHITNDKEYANQMFKDMEEVITMQSAPDGEPHLSNCKYCPYADKCKWANRTTKRKNRND